MYKTLIKQYIVFNIEEIEDSFYCYFIKVSENFRILDSFEYNVPKKRANFTFIKLFKQWLEIDMRKYKFYSFNNDSFIKLQKELLNDFDNRNSMARALKYNYFNIKKEGNFNDISIADALKKYSVDYIGEYTSCKDICYNSAILLSVILINKNK